jgi:hypothetical protein
MHILVTMNGRFGDVLWALPTLRCLAEASGEPVDLLLGEEFASIVPLLQAQAYLGHVESVPGWSMATKQPSAYELPGGEPDQVIHLSYPAWPTVLLPIYTWTTAVAQYRGSLPPLDLDTPWISVPQRPARSSYVYVGWTEEWIELKMGLLASVAFAQPERCFLVPHLGGRHCEFRGLRSNVPLIYLPSWADMAALLQGAAVYFGCLSAPWVLANALGRQTVIVEPSQARQNPIFYYAAARNHLVLGGDGQPTFHALYAAERLKKVLEDTAVPPAAAPVAGDTRGGTTWGD